MAGVAVEDALELWACSLREVKRRIRPLFSQERVAFSAGLFLDGLFGPERRKTGWMRAEAAGDPGPWGSRRSLGAAAGMPMRCAISYASMSLSTWRTRTPCWWLTRPVS